MFIILYSSHKNPIHTNLGSIVALIQSQSNKNNMVKRETRLLCFDTGTFCGNERSSFGGLALNLWLE
jgi:hypothetical protein